MINLQKVILIILILVLNTFHIYAAYPIKLSKSINNSNINIKIYSNTKKSIYLNSSLSTLLYRFYRFLLNPIPYFDTFCQLAKISFKAALIGLLILSIGAALTYELISTGTVLPLFVAIITLFAGLYFLGLAVQYGFKALRLHCKPKIGAILGTIIGLSPIIGGVIGGVFSDIKK